MEQMNKKQFMMETNEASEPTQRQSVTGAGISPEVEAEQGSTQNQPAPQAGTMPNTYPAAMQKQTDPVLEQNTVYFLAASLIYGVCFAIAFYKNYVGVTFPLIVAATVAVCVLFLRKARIAWRKENIYYMAPILLLGLSTALTDSYFLVFFNTVGILLLLAVFMLRQFYPEENWNLGQSLCNILFFYICMIPMLAAPFQHFSAYFKSRKKKDVKNPYVKPVLLGILIGIPLLLFVVAMLNSADAIFNQYIGGGLRYLLDQIVLSPNVVLVIFLLLFGFFASYAFLSALTLRNMPRWREKEYKKNPVTAITFIAMITAVYLIFCLIQLVFLFTGGLVLPKGYTYARYAHQGFFQLLFLCIFNLVLVLCCIRLFEKNKLLKILLLVFSGCTYIMMASSALRMILYIGSYHLSFLRVLVLWFLALLAFLMAGVIAQIWKKGFPFFRYSMAMVTVFYLALSFGHPDYWIARYNVAQLGGQMEYEDIEYLCGLSMDAAPAIAGLEVSHTVHPAYQCPACVLEEYFKGIAEDTDGMNIRTFNLSRYLAGQAAKEYLSE